MTNLKQSKKIVVLLAMVQLGCATSSFRITNQDGDATELYVTTDRILLECQTVVKDDGDIIYGFMIHILDEEKTVLNAIQTNAMDKESCFSRIKDIRKILETGQNIYIAGLGNLKDVKHKSEFLHFFPQHGSFYGNSQVLQFISLANESGHCYNALTNGKDPCPGFPFPLKKK